MGVKWILPAALIGAALMPAVYAGELEHPAVPFLDASGAKVVESGAPLSTMQTCGACHDTDYIASHSYHVSFGTEAERAARFDAVTYDGGDPAALGAKGLEAWTREFGVRHVGGGFATGTEMNCFICHLAEPAMDARSATLAGGELVDVPTATLSGTGLVAQSPAGWAWNLGAFDADGAPDPKQLGLQAPKAQNCGLCHGAVEMEHEAAFFLAPSTDDPETTTTGVVFAPGRIRRSGMNVAGKDELSRPWDVHAERLLDCISCHGSTNNPALYAESAGTRPGHLKSEARRLDVGEYLRTPSHDFAKGHVAQGQVGGEAAGSMRRCEDCHDASENHDFLPYRSRHFESMQCEACHIPAVYAPALEMADWTMLDADGQGLLTYRGVAGDPGDPRSLVTGYTPVLLPRTDPGMEPRLAPQNLASVFFWFDQARGARVPLATLRAALFDAGSWRPEILAALDADGDGQLAGAELHLTDPAAVKVVERALVVAGAAQPQIRGELKSYGVHHGVAPGNWAVRDCSVCHGEDARFSAATSLAAYLPGGVVPTELDARGVSLAGTLEGRADGGLSYHSDPALTGMSPLGFEPDRLVDQIGKWLVILTICGVLIHGGTRIFLFYNREAAARLVQNGGKGSSKGATL